jgi:hypothetical protein
MKKQLIWREPACTRAYIKNISILIFVKVANPLKEKNNQSSSLDVVDGVDPHLQRDGFGKKKFSR